MSTIFQTRAKVVEFVSGTGYTITYEEGANNIAGTITTFEESAAYVLRTGTVDADIESDVLTGHNTLFTTELLVGGFVVVNGEKRQITVITDDETLTVNEDFTTESVDVTFEEYVININNDLNIIGVGTTFLTDLSAGDYLEVNGEVRQIDTVISNLSLTIFERFNAVGVEDDIRRYAVKDNILLTGYIYVPGAGTEALGVNTLFTTELVVGDCIVVNGETRRVSVITDDITLTVDSAFSIIEIDEEPQLIDRGLLRLQPIRFDNDLDYTEVLTVTFDLTGTNVEQLELKTFSEVAPLVQVDSDTWTVTSQYVKEGYLQNVWADVTATISQLYLRVLNSDTATDAVVTCTISDGFNTDIQTVIVKSYAITDAINIVQDLTVAEDQFIFQLGLTSGLYPAIADLDEADRTYRVTFSGPMDKCAFYASDGATGVVSTTAELTNNIILEGTQTLINSGLSENSLYFMQGPDNTTPYAITYTQEVISGEVGVPYVQETGQFNFTITPTDAADTAVANINYSEDVRTSGNIASLNDTRDYAIGAATTTKFNATVTFADPLAVTSIQNWTDQGGGVFKLSAQYRGTMLSRLNDFRMTMAADYVGNTSMTLLVTRDGVAGDVDWWNATGWTNQTTLINEVITITNTAQHDEFTETNLAHTYTEDQALTDWNIGTFTDLAAGKQYIMTLTFSDPLAIESVLYFTDQGGGVFTQGPNDGSWATYILQHIEAKPAADYTGDFTFTYQQQQTTDGIDQGTSSNIVVTNAASHNEYSISTAINVGEYSVTNMNLGSITDLATSKNYTITLVLSDVTKGTINAPWVVGVPGTYTLSGDKTYLNGQLSAVPFSTLTLGDDVDTGTLTISYNQHQNTDNIAQGYTAVAATLTFVGVVDATNIIQSGLSIVEDKWVWQWGDGGGFAPQIADQLGSGSGRTYRVTLAPLTGADNVYTLNAGSSTTVVGDTWSSTLVFEGTQAAINADLSGTNGLHLNKTTVDNTYNFTIAYTQEVIGGAPGVPYTQEVGQLGFAVTPDVDAGLTVDTTYNNWNVDTASLLKTIATITDTRGDQYDTATILYRINLQTDTPVTNADGALSSAGTGGTTVWDNIDTLTIEGTKTQVNSHLATLTWTGTGGFSNAFTMNIELLRNINSTGWITHKSVPNILMNSGNGSVGQNTAWRYDEDEATLFNDATKLT